MMPAANAEDTLVDGILKYHIPPEKEDYTITGGDPFAMDIDPQLLGERESSTNGRTRSNVRLFPPPLFSRQGVPQNYKYVDLSLRSLSAVLMHSCSYKANTASVETIVVDDDTGEEKKRLINRMRWKGFGPISIPYTEKNVRRS